MQQGDAVQDHIAYLPCAGCRTWHPALLVKNECAGGIRAHDVPQEWTAGIIATIDCTKFLMRNIVRRPGQIPERYFSLVRQVQRTYATRHPPPSIGPQADLVSGAGGIDHRCSLFLCDLCGSSRQVRKRLLKEVLIDHWKSVAEAKGRHVEEYANSVSIFERLLAEAQRSRATALEKLDTVSKSAPKGRRPKEKTTTAVREKSSSGKDHADAVVGESQTPTSV